jgi:hypothetical protein
MPCSGLCGAECNCAGGSYAPRCARSNGGGPTTFMPPMRSAASRTRPKSTGPEGSVSAVAGRLAAR